MKKRVVKKAPQKIKERKEPHQTNVDNSPKLYNFYHLKIVQSTSFVKSDVLV